MPFGSSSSCFPPSRGFPCLGAQASGAAGANPPALALQASTLVVPCGARSCSSPSLWAGGSQSILPLGNSSTAKLTQIWKLEL